jgi:catechol-2,3-dioxygenase
MNRNRIPTATQRYFDCLAISSTSQVYKWIKTNQTSRVGGAARSRCRLFHLAIHLPAPLELAGAQHRLVNGIEIYRDYPRQEWPYQDILLQSSGF